LSIGSEEASMHTTRLFALPDANDCLDDFWKRVFPILSRDDELVVPIWAYMIW